MEIWLFNNLGLDIIIRDHYQGLYIQVISNLIQIYHSPGYHYFLHLRKI